MTRSAAYMADYANQHCCEVTFAVDSYAWLSTDHLKLPTNLSQKLASHYVGPFKVIEQINPVAFVFCCLMVGRYMMYFMYHN